MKKNILLWFRNDLRIHDSPLLNAALILSKREKSNFVCLYVFDKCHFQRNKYGDLKTSHHRANFITDSVLNLRSNLSKIGLPLVVAHGEPKEIIGNLCRDNLVDTVLVTEEVAYEEVNCERVVEEEVKRTGGVLKRVPSNYTLYALDDLPFRKVNMSCVVKLVNIYFTSELFCCIYPRI